ncbi:UDP-N-acetylmuramyl pentapeptide phosphotransferase [Brevibacillus sp. TJ4]|uniref:UDP-N-acetylmuramyl pentapeptide phosphotransferase n=1 Tax=Brevibacillus sp. TJ4 TaxID=3234853 RepID=UPI0037D7BDF5
MDAERIAAFVIAIGFPLLMYRPLFPVVWHRLQSKGMMRTNYRGEEVVTAGGLIIVFLSVATLLFLVLHDWLHPQLPSYWREELVLSAGILSMAFWGYLDDLSKEKETKGFRGHFGALLRERRVTSGVGKALGGGCTAVLAASVLSSSLWDWLLASCLLAASTNLLNLFDLRPGRAIKVFWLLIVAGIVAGGLTLWVLPTVICTLLLFRRDAGAQIMLGDTGANVLGFTAGFFLVVLLPWQGELALLALFAFIHVLAEFVSLSEIIQRNKWLARLDQWGRQTEQNRG